MILLKNTSCIMWLVAKELFAGPVKAYIYTIMNIHNLSVIFKTARKMLSYTITQFHFKEICIKMWFLTKRPTILVIYTVLHTDNICSIPRTHRTFIGNVKQWIVHFCKQHILNNVCCPWYFCNIWSTFWGTF